MTRARQLLPARQLRHVIDGGEADRTPASVATFPEWAHLRRSMLFARTALLTLFGAMRVLLHYRP